MSLFRELGNHPEAFILTLTLFGLIVGSFLNVVIHRLPLMMHRSWRQQCAEYLETAVPKEEPETLTLARPGSRCPHCGHAIGAFENVPIVSYVLQGGKCRHCRGPISVRYPIVEALGGLLAGIVAWKLGPGMGAIAGAVLTWAFLALTFIDLDHQLLPDEITLPFVWVGLLLAIFGVFTDLYSSVIGAAAGYLTLWSIFHLFKFATGKEGMGYGDFKLLALIGAWLGWQALPAVILLSSLVGAVVGILLILFRGHQRSTPIPFGPFLAAAGWIALLWGDEIKGFYLNTLV